MQQLLIGIIIVLGLGGYWLYNENQTLTDNNTTLEYALAEQTAAMETMRESYERQGKALMNMTRINAQIEQEKPKYLEIFSRHNLDNLALKKPGMIELRMNNASEEVMEGIENDTKELYNLSSPNTND